MTYEESANLMTDLVFRGRIKVAMLKYVTYVFAEPPESAGHAARYRWSQAAAQQPDMQAASLQPLVVMDGQVQADGADITDAALQTSVEVVINKIA